MIPPDVIKTTEMISVPIGRWAVAKSPAAIRTLLGSCVGIVLHDRQTGVGGLAHIVLPESRGAVDQPGKYANTAIPAMLADLEQIAGRKLNGRLIAKLLGGARMFSGSIGGLDIGQLNRDATETILANLGITVIARDLGGETGRNIVMSTKTGVVQVKVPGGQAYEI